MKLLYKNFHPDRPGQPPERGGRHRALESEVQEAERGYPGTILPACSPAISSLRAFTQYLIIDLHDVHSQLLVQVCAVLK